MKDKNIASKIGDSLGKSISELCYFLAVLFCALRACDIISWKWYWIMSPIFISWGLGVLFLALAGVITMSLLKSKKE